MQMSAQGIAALKADEGEVLRAYRCPAGIWTIGVGLTAASGVVRPKAGMVITPEQSTALLKEALQRSYEPAVAVAMSQAIGNTVTRPKQHEFDAGVSFHFNTGAIKKASWVRLWKSRLSSRHDIRAAMMLWTKGGGKVLPGLAARRERECRMLLDGVYHGQPANTPAPAKAVPPLTPGIARWGLALSAREVGEVRAAFSRLGYDPGSAPDSVLAAAVRAFQTDHGLTVDGVIGRATLSTLQRRLDAPGAAARPAAVGAPLMAASTTDVGSAYLDGLGTAGAEWVALALVGLWAVSTAWSYRDVIAAKATRLSPRLATFLRSF